MSRNIQQSALDYLASASSVRIAHLVRFDIPTEDGAGEPTTTRAYLTDYSSNITWNNKVYESGKITKIGEVRQSQGLTNYKLNIEVAGEDTAELDRGLIENLKYSYVGNEIEVLRAYLDDNGAIIPFDILTNGPMQYFIGDITDINISEGVVSGESTVTWQCAGKFQDFELINGRITDDTSHRAVTVNPSTGLEESSDSVKRESHKSDYGFQHANQTINVVTKYTTTETRYKLKKRRFWQSSKLVAYEVEVENELELGVSLASKFLPKIYGVQKISGVPVFIDALKNDPSTVYVVFAFSEGEIDGFLNFYIDGQSLICSSGADRTARVCLGNQAAGDTLSAFRSSDAEYDYLIDENIGDLYGGTAPGYSHIPPIIPTEIVDRTTGTDHEDFFTITNETGTKWVKVYHGKSDQAACPELVAEAAAGNFLLQDAWAEREYAGLVGPISPAQKARYWDESCKLLDTSYVVMKFAINEEETSVPELDAVVSGSSATVYDVVPMEGFSEGLLAELPNTYTLNPVWQLRDYMVDTLCGGSLDPALIDIGSFVDVAKRLDVPSTTYTEDFITYWRYIGWKAKGDPSNLANMQCNTLINTESTITKNIKLMLSQFDGTLNIIGGKYHLSTEGDSATVADLDIGDVIGSVKTTDLSNKDKWNSIQASIIDPGQAWGTTQINFFNSEYLKQDSGIAKKGNIGFNFITNYYTAREWAERMLNASRYSRELSFTTYFKYLYLKPNDNITFTYGRFKYDKKTFRVKSCTLKSDGTVALVLEDFDASIYNASLGSDTSGEVTPMSPAVQPPQNAEYVPLPDPRISIATPDNVHGVFLWDVPSVGNVLRYSVRDWQEEGPNYSVPFDQKLSDSGIDRNYIFITDLNEAKTYTFKVLAIDKFGKSSKYAVVRYTNTNTVPVSFSPVEGFSALNSVSGEFTGPDVILSWDPHKNSTVTTYEIHISYGIQTLRLVSITTGTETFTYTLALNIQDYKTNNSNLVGAYRDLNIKIRATNGYPEGDPLLVSSIWTNLI